MAIELALPPGLLIVLGSLLVLPVRGGARTALLMVLPAAALVLIWTAVPGVAFEFLGYTVRLFEPTALGRLFATVFAVALFAGNLFALRQSRPFELASASFYAGSAIGVTLCGDFISLFVFWEMMAIGSTAVILSAGTGAANAAGFRYLVLHVFGGMILLCGIIGIIGDSGTADLRPLRANDLYTWMILIGVLLNAGAPPFSAWVADAYPEASPAGAVYLSAFTTKAAVFVLLSVFPGEIVLVPVGLYMIFYGIIYALNENDMRRILAYSIVNQVGFMVVGVGIGTQLALNGAAAHAFTHIIYKALLMMSAGSVLMMTGCRKCTGLGGLYRSMRLTTLCAIVGALSISGFPLTSGFISKPMISASTFDLYLLWLWFALLAASAGVFLHAGVKFPWFVFFHRDSGLRPTDPPLNMRLAMILFSLMCVLIGLFPQWLYRLLPWPVTYDAYTYDHVIAQLQLLLFSGAAFFVLLPLLERSRTISLDFDWLYRRPGLRLYRLLWQDRAFDEGVVSLLAMRFRQAGEHLARWMRPDDAPVKVLQTRLTVGWLTALLALFLLLYYL